jgi:hypothetical protein
LFSSLNQSDEIDVIVAAGQLNYSFFNKCENKNIAIHSHREIPSEEFFNLEPTIMNRDPKSLHVTYDPKNDRLMIFGDESSIDGMPSCYCAEGVFQNSENQIVMGRVSKILNYPKSLDSVTGWNQFKQLIPITDNDFIKTVAKNDQFSCIQYSQAQDPELAQLLFNLLSEVEEKKAQELGTGNAGIAFVIDSAIEHIKDENHPNHVGLYNKLEPLTSIKSSTPDIAQQKPATTTKKVSSTENLKESATTNDLEI